MALFVKLIVLAEILTAATSPVNDVVPDTERLLATVALPLIIILATLVFPADNVLDSVVAPDTCSVVDILALDNTVSAAANTPRAVLADTVNLPDNTALTVVKVLFPVLKVKLLESFKEPPLPTIAILPAVKSVTDTLANVLSPDTCNVFPIVDAPVTAKEFIILFAALKLPTNAVSPTTLSLPETVESPTTPELPETNKLPLTVALPETATLVNVVFPALKLPPRAVSPVTDKELPTMALPDTSTLRLLKLPEKMSPKFVEPSTIRLFLIMVLPVVAPILTVVPEAATLASVEESKTLATVKTLSPFI